ncbi:GNAT family N-acetyltransferase [Bacillus salacetis]|uniref:GNAT family N-acetyltransferase n=1 Tax=Bacillus salacetis TaxID=2315464 RepID=A0A3A1RAB0_9BACI|nr:GNAT family N-acetyltransferase [Bacillus salacetis]RIW37402.1 GNAT family N-acetyltransferase [Bacillus salacetis]
MAIEMVELNNESLEERGCYCLRSKPKSAGYLNKNEWLSERFQEGMKYIKITENYKQAGFIEYTPIEFSSRVVYGENYSVIHCLWVSIPGQGYATKLIQKCIQDAREQHKDGVIVITNPETSWTPSKEIFMKNGFLEVDQAPYGFQLFVHKFGNSADPYFPTDWEERLETFTELTILRTWQCPFIEAATDNIMEGAGKLGIKPEVINMNNREELLRLSPTPYGVYGVVYKRKLVSFHRLTVHSAMKRLKELELL